MARTIFNDIDRYCNPYTLSDADLYWSNQHQYHNIASGRERAFTQFGHKAMDYRECPVSLLTIDVDTPVTDHRITMWDRIVYVKCKIMVRFGQWLIKITV